VRSSFHHLPTLADFAEGRALDDAQRADLRAAGMASEQAWRIPFTTLADSTERHQIIFVEIVASGI